MPVVDLPGALWETQGGGPLAGFGGLYTGGTVRATTVTEFSTGISTAVGSISADVKARLDQTNPDVSKTIDALGTVVESVSGSPLGSPIAIGVAKQGASIITKLVDGEAIMGSVAKDAAAAIESAGDLIPIYGEIASLIIGIVTYPKITAAEKTALDAKFFQHCKAIAAAPNAISEPGAYPTGPGNKAGPADLFRDGDYRAKMLMWLAGAASPSAPQRDAYNKWLSQAGPKYGIKGISPHVAKQMVALMSGIYAARRPGRYQAKKLPLHYEIIGDNGAALMPILMQIALDEGAGGPGVRAYTRGSLRSLADWFVAPGKRVCVKGEITTVGPIMGGRAGLACQDYGPCSHYGLSVGDMFYEFLRGWYAQVHSAAVRRKAEAAVAARRKGAPLQRLVLKAPFTNALMQDMATVASTRERAKQKEMSKAAIATTAVVVLGAGGLMLMRRRRRARA